MELKQPVQRMVLVRDESVEAGRRVILSLHARRGESGHTEDEKDRQDA
jgi:hypothetical protein